MSYKVICRDYEVPNSWHDPRPYREFRPYPPRIVMTCDSCGSIEDFGTTTKVTVEGETARIEGWLLNAAGSAACPMCQTQEPPRMHWIDLSAQGATGDRLRRRDEDGRDKANLSRVPRNRRLRRSGAHGAVPGLLPAITSSPPQQHELRGEEGYGATAFSRSS